MKIIVVVPTYNEVANLAAFAAEMLALPARGLRLLVVDDESPDGTGLQRADRGPSQKAPPRSRSGLQGRLRPRTGQEG
jgi:dolichol-phosphate mannosyltransferase